MSWSRVVRSPREVVIWVIWVILAKWGGGVKGQGACARRYQHMRFKLRLTFISRTIAQINALRLADSIGGGEEYIFIWSGIVWDNVLKY